MPVFVYILLGIALLITLLLFAKVKAYICFDDHLYVYAKLWFIKINLSIPKILESSKIQKLKRRARRENLAERRAEKAGEVSPIKPHPVVVSLNEIRVLLDAVFSYFLKKIHIKFLKLKVEVGCEDAATTALVHAYATQGVAYIIELLRNISNVDTIENSEVTVNANFISQKSDVEAKIELDFRLKDYLIFDYLSKREYKKKSN